MRQAGRRSRSPASSVRRDQHRDTPVTARAPARTPLPAAWKAASAPDALRKGPSSEAVTPSRGRRRPETSRRIPLSKENVTVQSNTSAPFHTAAVVKGPSGTGGRSGSR